MKGSIGRPEAASGQATASQSAAGISVSPAWAVISMAAVLMEAGLSGQGRKRRASAGAVCPRTPEDICAE
ncbi:hypothetical protein RSP03_26110 [Cereibacter sphaeroides]|nr:hypothetical protein RSP03_26110 [Cereibacter sphaeroides]